MASSREVTDQLWQVPQHKGKSGPKSMQEEMTAYVCYRELQMQQTGRPGREVGGMSQILTFYSRDVTRNVQKLINQETVGNWAQDGGVARSRTPLPPWTRQSTTAYGITPSERDLNME